MTQGFHCEARQSSRKREKKWSNSRSSLCCAQQVSSYAKKFIPRNFLEAAKNLIWNEKKAKTVKNASLKLIETHFWLIEKLQLLYYYAIT